MKTKHYEATVTVELHGVTPADAAAKLNSVLEKLLDDEQLNVIEVVGPKDLKVLNTKHCGL